jgi:hypothetical protein
MRRTMMLVSEDKVWERFEALRAEGSAYDDQFVQDVYSALELKEEQTKPIIKAAIDSILLFDKKQHDYGPGNISAFGEMGVLVRCNDKVQRLINLQGKENMNESVDDSWIDIATYGLIAMVWRRGEWYK